MMTADQRTAAMEEIGNELIGFLTAKVVALGGDEGDILSIAVSTCAATAVAFAALKATSAEAAVTLVRLLAESAAKDIYG